MQGPWGWPNAARPPRESRREHLEPLSLPDRQATGFPRSACTLHGQWPRDRTAFPGLALALPLPSPSLLLFTSTLSSGACLPLRGGGLGNGGEGWLTVKLYREDRKLSPGAREPLTPQTASTPGLAGTSGSPRPLWGL